MKNNEVDRVLRYEGMDERLNELNGVGRPFCGKRVGVTKEDVVFGILLVEAVGMALGLVLVYLHVFQCVIWFPRCLCWFQFVV